jgi:hypothetical protein
MTTPVSPEQAAERRAKDADALRSAMEAVATGGDAAGAAGASTETTTETTTEETPTNAREDVVVEESPAAVVAVTEESSVAVADAAEESPAAVATEPVRPTHDIYGRPIPEGAVVLTELPNNNGTTRPECVVTDEDVARLEEYLVTGFGLVHADGADGEGLAVVTVNATRIPGWAGSADRDAALKRIVKVLEETAAKGDYNVVIYFGNNDRTKGVVPSNTLNWLHDVHETLTYPVKKNVRRVAFVNASWIASAIISVSMSFISSKAQKKFIWTNSLEDMDKDSGFHLSASMCGEKFLASIGWTATTSETDERNVAPDAATTATTTTT